MQKRIGMNERVIKLLKFRTMTNEKDENGRLLPNEIRLTKLGRILRKTSIDELPSLLNVLAGDLSLVGPRPLLVDYLPFYKNKHRKRHDVRPVITGLAQINGRNSTTWELRLNFDVKYIENKSFLLDLKILFLTFFKVISSDGVEGNSDLSIIRLDLDKEYLELKSND
jgi:lipopolysaccharide/colanic/teichoic acid biosynthesis glycosyltransferase